jgi:hypothetical protein
MADILLCPACGHEFTLTERIFGKCEKCLHSVQILGDTTQLPAAEQPESAIKMVKTVQ